MLISFNDPTIFLRRPIALVLLALAAVMLVAPGIQERRLARMRSRAAARAAEGSQAGGRPLSPEG